MALDPRSCQANFFQTGRNFGRRPPSLSLRNVQRDIRAVKTSIQNIGTRIEGAIGAAGRGEFLPGQLLSVGNELRCPPTPYANFFSQHRPPKFKFMFFASLELHPSFIEAFGGQSWSEGEVWWFIKQSGRPNITYDYEEVNMYNFRQKVLRRATLEPISIQMYDDMQDASHSFWNTYIRIQNPVTNIRALDTDIEEDGMGWGDVKTASRNNLKTIRSTNGEVTDILPVDKNPDGLFSNISLESLLNLAKINPPAAARIEERQEYGPTGDPAPIESLRYSASTGVLPSNSQNAGGIPQARQLIKSIKIYHVIDWGQKVVVYDYINPRINEIRLDELNWESSDPSVIDVTFEYDTFHIYFPVGVNEETVQTPKIPPAYGINVNSDEVSLGSIGKVAANIPIPGL